jgi:4-amino-4-deoxy-L-arabinose transferase-like glycosyltransferase
MTPGAASSASRAPDQQSSRDTWRAFSATSVRRLLAILAVAFAARVIWIAYALPDPTDGRTDDPSVHYQLARSLADGAGYVNASGVATASSPPGYPSLLAAAFLLPGDDVVAGVTLNIVAGLVIVFGTYYLGSQLWDERAGLIAAGIMALFPSHIISSSLLLKDIVFAACLVGLMCLTLAWSSGNNARPWRVVLLGVLAAFAAMVRPEGFVIAGVIIVFWIVRQGATLRVARDAGLFVAGMLLIVLPWTARNYVEFDALIVSGTGGGLLLVDSHHDGATGNWIRTESLAYEYALRYEGLPPKEQELRVYEEATGDAIEYALSHPQEELRLAPERLAAFFRGDRNVLVFYQDSPGADAVFSDDVEQRWGTLADTYYYAIVAVMVVTLPFWIFRARREHVLLLGVLAVYLILWSLVFVSVARYHIPLLPVFATFAGIGVSAALGRWTERAPALAAGNKARSVEGSY